MAEDKDFALRVLRKSWNIVHEPEACVYHSHNYSIFSAFKRRLDDGKAYKQITDGKLARENGLNYLRSYLIPEFKFIWKKYRTWFPYSFFYEVMKILGFMFGAKC